MKRTKLELSRRAFLTSLSALGVALNGRRAFAGPGPVLRSAVPATGERLPVIGMGSWITFNVGDDLTLREARREVLQAFFDRGGAVIDSSPMYGSSEEVIGYCLERISNKRPLFSATKVWTFSRWLGVRQMEESRRLWGGERIDLMQIHNMLDWETHLETLVDWKARGRVRYIGMTTSHGRRHGDLEKSDGRATARLRPVYLQHPRSRGRETPAASGGRTRPGGDHQPALPARRAVRRFRAPTAAGLGK